MCSVYLGDRADELAGLGAGAGDAAPVRPRRVHQLGVARHTGHQVAALRRALRAPADTRPLHVTRGTWHAAHLMLLNMVPSSVLSQHRGHEHTKYLVSAETGNIYQLVAANIPTSQPCPEFWHHEIVSSRETEAQI